MSDRSSFITEYMYCGECAHTVWVFFKTKGWGTRVGDSERIVGGFHKGLGAYDDQMGFGAMMIELQKAICHPVRVTHIPEDTDFLSINYLLEPKSDMLKCALSKPADVFEVRSSEFVADWEQYAKEWSERIRGKC